MGALLFHYSLRRARRYFEHQRFAKLVTVFLFLLLVVLLALGAYAFFNAGFRFVARDQFLRDALTLYIYELFLLAVGILVFASALITGFFNLFYEKSRGLLMASPKYSLVPRVVFVRMCLASLWPLFIIAVPALFAIRRVFGLGIGEFAILLFVFALFVIGMVAWAMVLLLGVSVLLYFLGGRNTPALLSLRNVLGGVVFIFFLLLVYTWGRLKGINLIDFFQARMLGITVADTTPIIRQFAVFPSHLVALALFAATKKAFSGVFLNVAYLGVCVAFGLGIVYMLARQYLWLWQIFQEGRFTAASVSVHVRRRGILLRTARGSLGAIFSKEIITFFRNARGMMWLGFLLLIWCIQSASSFIVRHQLGGERVGRETVSYVVDVLQFAVIIYFVSMFVLRFAFPSFSMEKKTAWLLKSAPIDLGNVFLAKAFFYTILFSFFGIFFTLFNASLIQMAFQVGTFLFVVVVFAIVTITLAGLGLGALYPNFETDDPEVLSTSLPGLIFIFGSLLYGACGAFALWRMLLGAGSLLFEFFVVFSFLSTIFFTYIPYRAIGKMEF